MKKKTLGILLCLLLAFSWIYLCACKGSEQDGSDPDKSENGKHDSQFPLGENELPWVDLD